MSSDLGKPKRTTIPLQAPQGAPEQRFRVLQWNVLADGLAQNGDFVKTPPEVLEWSYRQPLVIEEMLESKADIICLQELNHYHEMLEQLTAYGFKGHFQAKFCSAAEKYNCPADGLAIFYNAERFRLVGDAHGQTYVDEEGHQQSQCFLQVRLHDTRAGRDVVVVTTHLKAKEGVEEDTRRMQQMKQLLRSLEAVLQPAGGQALPRNGNGNGSNGNGNGNGNGSGSGNCNGSQRGVPVILTGDFNATPESAPCKELKAHPAGFTSLWDLRPLYSTDVDSSLLGTATSTSMSMSMEGSVWDEGGPREFSTWKFRSKGESKRVIDHIWFTCGRILAPVSRWRMLTEQEIGPEALPSRQYASDHMSLCCEFEWREADSS